MRLYKQGHVAQAKTVAEENIALLRRLYAKAPATQIPALAAGLANFALRLNATGEHARAVATAREAVELLRPFHRAAPAFHDFTLLGALTNLAVCLADSQPMGIAPPEAIEAQTEALEIARSLANRESAYEPYREDAWQRLNAYYEDHYRISRMFDDL